MGDTFMILTDLNYSYQLYHFETIPFYSYQSWLHEIILHFANGKEHDHYCKALLPVSSLVVHKIYCVTLGNVARVYP